MDSKTRKVNQMKVWYDRDLFSLYRCVRSKDLWTNINSMAFLLITFSLRTRVPYMQYNAQDLLPDSSSYLVRQEPFNVPFLYRLPLKLIFGTKVSIILGLGLALSALAMFAIRA